MTDVVAVVVLYRQTPQESSALRALFAVDPAELATMTLLIYDNSPESQAHLLDADVLPHYVHDPANGRLLSAYRAALALACELQARWLMLLDQDTEVTAAYFKEALAQAAKAEDGICAITPRLIVHGEQRSPHTLVPAGSNEALLSGLSSERLMAWNSGALLQVSRLLAIGGFPAEFPLDNLDYATFFRLQQTTDRIYVMESRLRHSLSVADPHSLSLDRLRGKLESDLLLQRMFLQRSRFSLAVEFLRTGVSLLRKLSDKRMGLLCLRYGFRCLAG